MDEKIERLLYTTKDGIWYWETDYAADKLELDDEDIDFDRIPEIRKLLTKPVASLPELYVPLEAALVLTSWGDEEGLRYLEYVVNLRPDRWGNGEPHRLRCYDTTYEWIANSVIFFRLAHLERTGKDVMRKRVFPILSMLLKYCETLQFEFPLHHFLHEEALEYDSSLKSYLRAMLADKSDFHHHKPGDAVKFFLKYDPVFLETVLKEANKNLSDYSSYINEREY
ncbi:hypothetical protein [Terasakiella pusilla]|uniref:hypothetical protein n=1 Tax=Terasakiella pusilla TaxID=64973 RepID=UPI00048FDAD5|nr:hypothetical protein [Terasakiella pusilla]